jgi:hypothetical protein
LLQTCSVMHFQALTLRTLKLRLKVLFEFLRPLRRKSPPTLWDFVVPNLEEPNADCSNACT